MTVVLDVADWCPWHLEPFREDFPAGWGVAGVRMIEALLVHDAFTSALPTNPTSAQIDAVKAEFRPLCCTLGDETMASIYRELGKTPPEHLSAARRAKTAPLRGTPFPRSS